MRLKASSGQMTIYVTQDELDSGEPLKGRFNVPGGMKTLFPELYMTWGERDKARHLGEESHMCDEARRRRRRAAGVKQE